MRYGRRGANIGAAALLIPALIAGASAPPARAEEMRLTFVATATAVHGVNDFAADGLAVGGQYTVSFTFDPLAGDVYSTPYHAIENTPSGPVDYGYFGQNYIFYSTATTGPSKTGTVRAEIDLSGRVIALTEVDQAFFYASGQPGAEGYLAVEAQGLLPGGAVVSITDALFALDVVPLLSRAQSVSSDGNAASTAVLGAGDGAVLGTPGGVTLEAVPEPSGWTLAINGVGLLGWNFRRRRGPSPEAITGRPSAFRE